MPFGIKLEVNEVGLFKETFTANHKVTSTISAGTDGTYDRESKTLLSTNEEDIMVGNGHGTGKMTGPKSHAGEGEGIFMTQFPKLWCLNKTTAEFSLQPICRLI